jgi:PAS domain S-box-containing protein
MANPSSRASSRSLGAYLALAFFLLPIVLTVVLVEVIERAALEEVKSRIGRGLGELAMQASDKLDRRMFERYREIALLAQRRDLTGPGTSIAERRRILASARDTYEYYDWIGMAGLDGRVQVAAGGLLEGADVSQRPWFGNALRGIHLGDVHEAKLLAGLLPPVSGGPRRFVDIAFPYVDAQGKPAGVLAAHVSWGWAHDVERSTIVPAAASNHVQALIVDSRGLVLLGPPGLQGATLAQPSLRYARQRDNGFLEEAWPDGRSYLVGFSRTQGYGQYPGLGWTVLVRQDVERAYLPVKQLRRQALWSGMALALLFSLVGVFVARRITRPLGQLARSAQRIGRGETVPLETGGASYFEVQALGGSLNALVADLVQRKQELSELNATLEARVEARTRELEQALQAVQASEQRINTIIEASQDAFIGVDLQGRIIDWNRQAQAMFGWSRDEAIGKVLAQLVVPKRYRANVDAAMRQFHETGHTSALERRVECIVFDRGGTEFPVEMTAGLAGTTETAFFSLFVHDISERKKVERMKNEFVSTVSHELRTPLTSIRASLSLMADGMAGELPADARALVDIAVQSCERLMRLIGDVLDIQKIEAGDMRLALAAEPLLPLIDQALDAMQAYAQQMGVALERDCAAAAQGLLARVDHDRMMQVLTNLLSNAIKFSRRGETVTVRLEAAGARARIAVIDHGCGIPDEFRPRMFQRFAQADSADSRKKGGTGLGLAICKSLVEKHGGTIWYESDGGGTRFYVELALADAAAAA